MSDEVDFDRIIGMCVIGAIVIFALLFGDKAQAPSSVDGSYNTRIHVEDNDTTVCVFTVDCGGQ